MFDGYIRELQGVRYVCMLKRNLISFGVLDAHGCVVKAKNNTIKVFNSSMNLMRGVMKNGMYVLDGNTTISYYC